MKLFHTKLVYVHHFIWKEFYVGNFRYWRHPVHEVTP